MDNGRLPIAATFYSRHFDTEQEAVEFFWSLPEHENWIYSVDPPESPAYNQP